MFRLKFNSKPAKEQATESLFDSSDRIILFLALGLFLASSFLFLNYKISGDNKKSSAPVAKISSTKNSSQRRTTGSFVWEELIKNTLIYQGDQIVTLENSSTDVRFNNGTKLQIPENSLIKIDATGGELNIVITRGILDVFLGKDAKSINLLHNGKSYKVTPDSKNFRVKVDDKDFKIFSKNGKLMVNNGKSDLLINKGLEKSLDKKAVKKKSVVQYIKVNSSFSGKSIPYDENLLIDLNWTSSLKGEFDILTSTSRDFKKNTIIFKTKSLSKKIKIGKPGKYYNKITAQNNDKTISSNILSYNIVTSHAPEIIYPKNRTIVNLKKSKGIIFKWKRSRSKNYIFRIQAPDGKKLEKKTTENIIKINKFPSTKFTWQVKKDQAFSEWGPLQNIRINYSGEIEIITPLHNKEFIKKSKVFSLPFRWKKDTDNSPNTSYILKISKDNKHLYPIRQEVLKENSYIFKDDYLGQVFWSVANKESPEIKSPLQRLVIQARVASLIRPYKDEKIVMKREKIKNILNFKWTILAPNITNDVYLLVSDGPKFKKTLLRKKLTTNQYSVPISKPGRYFWKISPVKSERTKNIIETQVHKFSVKIPSSPKAPLITRKQLIRYKKHQGKGTYQIRLPKIKKGELLEITIYNKKNKKKILFKQKTNSKYIYWQSKRFGVYYYRLKLIDSYGQTSKYSRYGKLIFPISPFSQ